MADEFGEVDAIPDIAAEQRVCIGHGPNAPIERVNVVVERTAALAHVLGDGGNACQQILDVMIECGDQQALLVRGPLARGDVEREALETYKAPPPSNSAFAVSSSQTSRPSRAA